jgi:hypothetical protein
LIRDGCVALRTDSDDDLEIFRLMRANKESAATAYPALFEFACGTSTEELAHYLEHGRKGAERNCAALQAIERKLRTAKYLRTTSHGRDAAKGTTRAEVI